MFPDIPEMGADIFDNPCYSQNHLPIRRQTEAVGHAVRAMYLYTAMADLAIERRDSEVLAACQRLWKNVTGKRMYLTGGIGSTGYGEAFTADYDLPNDMAFRKAKGIPACTAKALSMA